MFLLLPDDEKSRLIKKAKEQFEAIANEEISTEKVAILFGILCSLLADINTGATAQNSIREE